jgi:hypothetical protein
MRAPLLGEAPREGGGGGGRADAADADGAFPHIAYFRLRAPSYGRAEQIREDSRREGLWESAHDESGGGGGGGRGGGGGGGGARVAPRGSISALAGADEAQLQLYHTLAPLRRLLRVLGVWHPRSAPAALRWGSPLAVAALLVASWGAHFGGGEGAATPLRSNSLIFVLVHALYLWSFAEAVAYFRAPQFVRVVTGVLASHTDVYARIHGLAGAAARAAARQDALRCAVRAAMLRVAALTGLLFVCHAGFFAYEVSSGRRGASAGWELLSLVAIVVASAQFVVFAVVARLVFQIHALDMQQLIGLFHFRHAAFRDACAAGGGGGSGSSSRVPWAGDGRLREEAEAAEEAEASHLCVLGPLQLSREDVIVLDGALEFVALDYSRAANLVRDSAHALRRFIVFAMLDTFLGFIFSAYVLAHELGTGEVGGAGVAPNLALFVPNLLQLLVATTVMAEGAKVTHNADKLKRSVGEFRMACNLRDASRPFVCAAFQAFVNARPPIVSLFGVTVDRNLLFVVLGPAFGISLFLLQTYLSARD